MIPKILLPKGTVIRIGKTYGVREICYGLEVKLQEDLDHAKHTQVKMGIVVKNPNGWQNQIVTHNIKDADELVSLGEGSAIINNQSASILLKKEEDES